RALATTRFGDHPRIPGPGPSCEGARRRFRIRGRSLPDALCRGEGDHRHAHEWVSLLQARRTRRESMTLQRTMPSARRVTTPEIRCAIYTRKSTEEGLEQEFNTLNAQRESAEAYIKSQQHAGWTCLPDLYDDGGYTGGNMERPALQRLKADIEAGK